MATVYETITQRIMAHLETGTVPWQQPSIVTPAAEPAYAWQLAKFRENTQLRPRCLNGCFLWVELTKPKPLSYRPRGAQRSELYAALKTNIKKGKNFMRVFLEAVELHGVFATADQVQPVQYRDYLRLAQQNV